MTTKRKRKPRSEREKQIRRYKYAIVYNTYGNSKVAQRARDLSFEQIYQRMGVYIEPKQRYRVPETKPSSSRKQKYYNNYLKHRSNGYETEEAFYWRTKPKLPSNFPKVPSGMDEDLFRQWGLGNRKQDWSLWSSNKSRNRFPSWIIEYAQKINTEEGMKANARYGYATLYYIYVQRWEEIDALEYVEPDKASPLDFRYKGDVKA